MRAAATSTAVRQYYGYRYVVPTHQGVAEHLISNAIQPGRYVLLVGNMYFHHDAPAPRAGRPRSWTIVDEAHDPGQDAPFMVTST